MNEPREVRVRFARPPNTAPSLRYRIIDAWRVLIGRAVAAPVEKGLQWSEWSAPKGFDPVVPPDHTPFTEPDWEEP